MSEAGAAGHEEEREWWLRERPAQQGSPEEHLPQPGMEVAGYRLERRLGTGGQGTVFRARREGRLFAVKFIYLRHSARWGWRELDVMVKLWRDGGLLLEGYGFWPACEPLFLFLVTPYVHGLPLDVWTRLNNPSALQVARLVLQAARQLQPVHAAGVVHRDVKGANLLVDEEGRLVLVDFGVATYEGAPAVTGAFPPGSWPYLSPRVWRAWRGEEKSRPCPGDDVWALGVELYQLLTGRLPFRGHEGELVRAILHEEPEAPHEANPRVPRGLGELCQRMLRKQPGERFSDAWALEAALEEVLKQADAAWEVPLCEAWGPQSATTVRQDGARLTGGEWAALRERLSSYERRPVRGRPLPLEEASTLAAPEAGPPGPEEWAAPPASEDTSRQAAPAAAPEVAPGVGEARGDVPPLAPVVEAAPLPPASAVREAQGASGARVEAPRGPGLEPAVAAVSPSAPVPGVRSRMRRAAGVLGLCVGLAVGLLPRGSERPTLPVGTPRADLRSEWLPLGPEPIGQEVAPPWKRPEGDGGAAPQGAPTTAPVARATHSEDTRVKTQAKPPRRTPQQPPKETGDTLCKAGALALCCTLASGCAGPTATAQVRPLPGPAECPPGAVDTMKAMGIPPGTHRSALWWPLPSENFITVREGPVTTIRIDQTDTQLPPDTLLSGELFFSGGRVHGRFTQARAPAGDIYPVCMVLEGREDDSPPGVAPEGGFGRGTARLLWSQGVRAVERFE
jgi:hypothetical protein